MSDCAPPKIVETLTSDTFETFMRNNDAALVLFVDSDCPEKRAEKTFFLNQMTQAAKITERKYTAYAMVDCTCQSDLCCKEDVPPCRPLVRLYSGVTAIGNIRERTDINSIKMKEILEMAPAIEDGSWQ